MDDFGVVQHGEFTLSFIGPDPIAPGLWIYRLNTGKDVLFQRLPDITDDQFRAKLVEWLIFYEQQLVRREENMFAEGGRDDKKQLRWKQRLKEAAFLLGFLPMIAIISLINFLDRD